MPQYTALHSLLAPDTLVFGYHRGDPVPAEVAENWGLAVGVDVADGNLDNTDTVLPVPARPDPGANRAAWEAYAVGHGMNPDDAATAPIEDLQADRDAKGRTVERPADTAKKADWVAYVKKLGADKAWADDDATTRAELQAWRPDEPVQAASAVPAVPGDPAAVAANEAAKGA